MDPSILWSQPGDREPAPSVSLHLLQDFVNTNDVEGGDDGLGSPALLREWLVAHGLMDQSDDVTEPAWRRAIPAVRRSPRPRTAPWTCLASTPSPSTFRRASRAGADH